MLHIKMKSISVLVAYLAVSASAFSLSTDTSHEYSCINFRKPCTLQNVILETESELDGVTFPVITDPLIIESGRIAHFTRKLAEKLAGIVDLTINQLQLETLYVKPEMTHLEAKYNQIETLLVDNDQAKIYEMLTLDLTGNKLSNVEILSRFAKLRQLTLDENSLEQLSMDVFTGMSELRKLSLANNKLYTVDTGKSLQLLKLRSLSLAGNQLLDLNVENWELDSLMELNLSNNKLYLLDGSLGQFKALVDVKISENFWKCEFLVGLNRLERLKLDHDVSDRCRKNDLSDVKQVCCTYDASSILGNTAGDLGLFHEKWEELRQLSESFQQFKNAAEQNQQRIGELEEDNQITLVERIKQLEDEQQKIWDKLNDREESVAVEEISELKGVISHHKETIQNIEEKQSNLGSELEGFVDILNSLRERMDEKFVAVDEVNEKVTELENKTNGDEVAALENKVRDLKDAFKQLEGQQLKYHLSSVDLKSQIGAERSRISDVLEQYTKLLEETDRLRDQMGNAQKNINIILKILNEMNSEET